MEKPILKILHLDDDALYLEQFTDILKKKSDIAFFVVESVSDVTTFYQKLEDSAPHIVILDINLGEDLDGRRIASAVKRKVPNCVVLMCSDHKGPSTVSKCFQAGADDFIFKGGDESELAIRLFGAWRLKHQGGRSNFVKKSLPIVAGKMMSDIALRIERILQSAVSAVHVRGESGTGKELIGEMVESMLPKGTPFIKVNCGAISPTLIESELFGYVKGAFTGAVADKKGLIEDADGGWIFLDEVATLSMPTQIALLRALESGAVRKVGSSVEKKLKIRVLTATNEPIDQMIKDGRFRADLWQRLCEATIELKPLRERMEEVPQLVEHFCRTMTNGPYQTATSTLDLLLAYDWHEGNVRELRNCLRAMTELSINGVLPPLSLPKWFWDKIGETSQDEREGFEKTALPLSAAEKSLTISWDSTNYPSFDAMTQMLLLQLVRTEFGKFGKVSIRQLGKIIGMPKTTLSTRLRSLATDQFISIEELGRMVSVGK